MDLGSAYKLMGTQFESWPARTILDGLVEDSVLEVPERAFDLEMDDQLWMLQEFECVVEYNCGLRDYLPLWEFIVHGI